MASDDAGQQYVPLDKLKVYQSNGLVSNKLRKLNFGSAFALTENDATGSIDFGVSPGNLGVSLNDLTDVVLTTPTIKQVICFDGTNWKNGFPSIDDLSDVIITTPANKHVIKHDGTSFKNSQLSLNDILNVLITSPANGDVIIYDGTNFKNQSPSAGITSLDGLSDVAITSPAAGHIIQHNGTQFVNQAPSAVSLSLDNLTDVVITTPTAGQTLAYNGTNWVNQSREELACSFGPAGVENLPSAFTDMQWSYVNFAGSSLDTGTKPIASIDFTGKTQYKVAVGVVMSGGTGSVRIVDDATPTNILHTVSNVGSSTTITTLAALPAWATGVKTLRLQAGNGDGSDDIGTPMVNVYLK